MQFFFFGILALILFLILVRLFIHADVKMLANFLRVTGAIVCLTLGLVLMVRGLGVLAIPLFFLGLSLLFRVFTKKKMWRGGRHQQPGSTYSPHGVGHTSEVQTDYLRMTLDHDSGSMGGFVLKGTFSGWLLDDMQRADLIRLWQELNVADKPSAQLLEAYLDRNIEGWRGAAQTEDAGSKEDYNSGSKGALSVDEAYDILGLKPGASLDEIHKAHRNLMKQFHPDQGGSTYLASRINEARDLLVEKIS